MKSRDGLTLRTIIRQTILSMDRPFSLSDLFRRLEDEHQITNHRLIMTILEELCESGVIEYADIDDLWRYRVVSRLPAYI